MIISKMNFEFSNASWATRQQPRESVRRAFAHTTNKPVGASATQEPVERMSLGELLYMVLMSEEAAV